MGRPISFAVHSDTVAPSVTYGTLVDEEYLHARLAELGGKDAALLELDADEQRATTVLRQGIEARHLPSYVQSMMSGDIVVRRTETWTRAAENHYDGTIRATVKGTPAVIELTTWIKPVDGRYEFGGHGEAKVSVPLVGGKIEKMIAEQVSRLLALEAEFTLDWIKEHEA